MGHICVCGKLVEPGRSTCSSSYCQEADYYLNAARNARKARRKAAHEIAAAKVDVAVAASRELRRIEL